MQGYIPTLSHGILTNSLNYHICQTFS
ncbi:hypothetical protein RRG08_046687, partial [Elysia crispata]